MKRSRAFDLIVLVANQFVGEMRIPFNVATHSCVKAATFFHTEVPPAGANPTLH